jgi:hypothetical protein
MIRLPEVLAAAVELQTFCRQRNWRFCFIGGIAVQRWGNPRLTQVVDLTLLTGFGNEERFVEVLLGAYSARRSDARDFALSRRVLLVRTASGIDVDIALGAFPFEERSIGRATDWRWETGASLTTCTAEDLLVHKVFAGRDRDWADVESVLIRQRGKLDFHLVRCELTPLLDLKGEAESLDKLERMMATVERRLNAKP